MHDSSFSRQLNQTEGADQLGRLVSLGIKWAKVLQEDRPNVELRYDYWCRPMSLAAKVEGIPVSESVLKWVWETIRTAPALTLDSLSNEHGKVKSDHPATAPIKPSIGGDEKPKPLIDPTSDLSGPSRQCLEALRQWRATKARRLGCPAYVIARDTILIELAKHRPTELVDLYSIQSISYGFSERYGEEIVQLLSGWCTENMEDLKSEQANDQVADHVEQEPGSSNDIDGGFASGQEPSPELEDGHPITAAICQHCSRLIPPERIEVFPDAKYCVKCQELADEHSGSIPMAPPTCPRCERKGIHSKLVYRRARDPAIKGYFLGCSRYPHCQYLET
jgi:RNA polymerase-binding transcription factor DksA